MHTVKINGARLIGVDLGDDVDQLLVGQLVVHGGQDLLQRCGRNEAVAYKKKDKNPINTLTTANFAELVVVVVWTLSTFYLQFGPSNFGQHNSQSKRVYIASET